MAVNETLLPCPFCGDKAVLGSAGGNSEVDGYRRAHTVTCKGCGMHKLTFSRPYEGPSEAEAIVAVISAWNTRSDSSQARLSEAVKVLEGMVKWLNYLPAPYPDDSQMIMALTAKAKAFLATIGEENEA